MPIVTSVNDIVFDLDGTESPRLFFAVKNPLAVNNIDIRGIYDSTFYLVTNQLYSNFTVDGKNTWANADAVIAALQPILIGGVLRSMRLEDLANVQFTSVANNDLIKLSNGKWVNTTPSP